MGEKYKRKDEGGRMRDEGRGRGRGRKKRKIKIPDCGSGRIVYFMVETLHATSHTGRIPQKAK
jgi:hypothetical protein